MANVPGLVTDPSKIKGSVNLSVCTPCPMSLRRRGAHHSAQHLLVAEIQQSSAERMADHCPTEPFR